MTQFRARDFDIDYEGEYGINLNTLGAVMLDLELQPGVMNFLDDFDLEPYTSDDPDQWWINGITPDHHVTLRYGMLEMVRERDVMKVIPSVIEHLEYDLTFPCHIDYFEGFDSEYIVLVFKMTQGSENWNSLARYITDSHNALGVLPNLATFNPPTFHITLGYFKNNPEAIAKLSKFTRQAMLPVEFKKVRCGKNMRP